MPPRLRLSTRAFAVIVTGLGAATTLHAGPPRHLQSRQPTVTGDPFQSALTDEAPPPQYGAYRYLGRATQSDHQRSVVFDDQQTTADHADLHSPLWGHGRIEQTQYPFSVPPADQAPDEPRRLPVPTDELACDDCPPSLTIGSTQPDVTSVLGSGEGLGFTTVGLRTVIESPRLAGFSLRPIFGMHLLSGPISTDLPARVYDVSLEARAYYPFGDRWLGEFALAPGIFSDFQSTDDAFRLVARAVGYYKCSETLRLAMGATYLDRQDITWLPIGGVIWAPNDDWRYEIMFPQPRIAHRYWCDGDHERWAYIRGELGGGSWAIERSNGISDIATYRDLRLLLGVEFKHTTGNTWLLEAGYAFGRELEYQSGIGDYDPDATAVVRAALTF